VGRPGLFHGRTPKLESAALLARTLCPTVSRNSVLLSSPFYRDGQWYLADTDLQAFEMLVRKTAGRLQKSRRSPASSADFEMSTAQCEINWVSKLADHSR
jgi:hypothetical protein